MKEKADLPGEKLVPVPICLFSCEVFILFFVSFFFYSREYSQCNLVSFKTQNISLKYSNLEKTVTLFALFVMLPEEWEFPGLNYSVKRDPIHYTERVTHSRLIP
jgi:hypothetical protein